MFSNGFNSLNGTQKSSSKNNQDEILRKRIECDCVDSARRAHIQARPNELYSFTNHIQGRSVLIEGGNKMERLVRKNMGLVFDCLKIFKGQYRDLDDLVQEGAIALMDAINTFDASKGFKFSTYAEACIIRAMAKYIAKNARNVRIPQYIYEDYAKIHKFQTEYITEYGCEPTYEEISDALEISEKAVARAIGILSDPEYSLDYKLDASDSESATFVDTYILNEYANPEEEVCKKHMREDSLAVLNSLDNKDQIKVLSNRFGFNEEGEVLGHKEIGEKMGFSKQRSHQIEKAGLKKLSSEKNIRKLNGYL